MQEQQAAAASAAANELPALGALLVSVVQGPADKKQRAAEALGCACGILEALRRLLPDQVSQPVIYNLSSQDFDSTLAGPSMHLTLVNQLMTPSPATLG